jgi:hypothetical protein
MSGASGCMVPPSQRRTLPAGPLGALLLLGGDRTAGTLSLVQHPLEPRALDVDLESVPRLAAALGLRVPGGPPPDPA